jgi:hypothetical protein
MLIGAMRVTAGRSDATPERCPNRSLGYPNAVANIVPKPAINMPEGKTNIALELLREPAADVNRRLVH